MTSMSVRERMTDLLEELDAKRLKAKAMVAGDKIGRSIIPGGKHLKNNRLTRAVISRVASRETGIPHKKISGAMSWAEKQRRWAYANA